MVSMRAHVPKHISACPSLQHSPGPVIGVAETSLTQQCAGPLIMFAGSSGLGLPSLTLQPNMPMKFRCVGCRLWNQRYTCGSTQGLLTGQRLGCSLWGELERAMTCHGFCLAGLSDACVRLQL